MLVENFWITRLLAMKSVRNAVNREGVALYLFGSALQKINPNDLDILIAYDKQFISVGEALYLRRNLSKSIFIKLEIDVDCILLTKQEVKQTNFVNMEKAILIFP